MPDAKLAKELGTTINVVIAKRQSLGLSTSGLPLEARRPWTKKELAMLGRIPDAQVAEATGRGRRHIRSKRESLGIPPSQKQFIGPWTKKMVSQLGKATDTEVAKNLGVNTASVALQRARRGIAAFRDSG